MWYKWKEASQGTGSKGKKIIDIKVYRMIQWGMVAGKNKSERQKKKERKNEERNLI